MVKHDCILTGTWVWDRWKDYIWLYSYRDLGMRPLEGLHLIVFLQGPGYETVGRSTSDCILTGTWVWDRWKDYIWLYSYRDLGMRPLEGLHLIVFLQGPGYETVGRTTSDCILTGTWVWDRWKDSIWLYSYRDLGMRPLEGLHLIVFLQGPGYETVGRTTSDCILTGTWVWDRWKDYIWLYSYRDLGMRPLEGLHLIVFLQGPGYETVGRTPSDCILTGTWVWDRWKDYIWLYSYRDLGMRPLEGLHLIVFLQGPGYETVGRSTSDCILTGTWVWDRWKDSIWLYSYRDLGMRPLEGLHLIVFLQGPGYETVGRTTSDCILTGT